jgi:hypothetical protein
VMKKTRDTESVHWSYNIVRSKREDAYKYDCPKCGAKPQAPCTYRATDNYKQRKVLGKPTERPHVERTYLVQKKIYQARQEQLRAWLGQYGDIFQEEL